MIKFLSCRIWSSILRTHTHKQTQKNGPIDLVVENHATWDIICMLCVDGGVMKHTLSCTWSLQPNTADPVHFPYVWARSEMTFGTRRCHVFTLRFMRHFLLSEFTATAPLDRSSSWDPSSARLVFYAECPSRSLRWLQPRTYFSNIEFSTAVCIQAMVITLCCKR